MIDRACFYWCELYVRIIKLKCFLPPITVVSNQMNSSARTVKYTSRPSSSSNAAIRAREAMTARAFAKALQIESCDSARNRTMWNRLMSVAAVAAAE